VRIILIVSDTFRYDHLGLHGNDWIITPELDQFGREAVVFDNCYVSSFPTIPHRCDMNTGRWGFPFHGWQPLEPDEIPLAERLRDAGLFTQLICDCPHMLRWGVNFWRGFHGYYWNRGQESDIPFLRLNELPETMYERSKTISWDMKEIGGTLVDVHRWINQERVWEGDTFAATTSQFASKWIEQNYKCEDFFLWVDFFDVHEPWDPPEHFVELYDPGYTCQRMMHPNYGRASWYTTDELRNLRANYAGEVTLISKWVGNLLRKIKDCGIYDDTLVIFTSDHGMYIGEHDRTGKHNHHESDDRGDWPMYKEITHIPLMVKPPHCKGGLRRSEPVQPPDICPTILEAAGVGVPENMMGRSLGPLLDGAGGTWDRKYAVSGRQITDSADRFPPITVSDGAWSLHVGAGREPELYDLASDPGQETNVAADHADRVAEMKGAIIELVEGEAAPQNRIDITRGVLGV